MSKVWTPGGVHRSEPNAHATGARLGPRIAKVITDAQEYSQWRMSGMRAKEGADAANLFFHGINRELRQVLAPLLHDIAQHEDLDPKLKPLADFVARQPGEGAALIGLAASGVGYASGIGTVIADIFAPVIQSMLRANPNLLLPSNVWSQAAAQRLIHESLLADAYGRQGIDAQQADLALRASYTYPPLELILAMWRRGIIDEGTAQTLMTRQAYTDQDIPWLMQLSRVMIPPADVADMVVRGVVDQTVGQEIAGFSGVDATDFDRMVKATGEPPGIMQLLEAYRRGFIDEPTLRHGVRQSRVKDEWFGTIEKLRYSPMDISDAARAVVQNYMDQATANRIADANGLEPGAMETLIRIQGEPLGHQQMAELYNRGLITYDQFAQSIRESHVKDKYIPAAIELRRRLLPERQIVSALEHGALTDSDAVTHLMQTGYNERDSHILIDSARSAAVGREKELAKGDVLTLFMEYSISEAQAKDMLHALGYHGGTADYLLAIASFRRTAQDINHVMTVLHRLYVQRWIDESELRNDLAKLGVPPQRIDHAVPLWTLERDTTRRHMTEAQIVKAVKHGVLNPRQGEERLVAMGYSETDAMVLLEVG